MSCRETIMTTGRLLALALAALAGGCANPPPDISANYQVLYLPADAPGARPTAIVAPEACLQPDTTRYPFEMDPHLPPGCANAYNLERMVERKADLFQGRKPGPAAAAPVARAARRYLDGDETPLGGAFDRDGRRNSRRAPAQVTTEQR